MFAIICVIVFGALYSYFATYNTQVIAVSLGHYKEIEVALYLIILIALGIGFFMAYVIYISHYLSTSLTINEQKDSLKTTKKNLATITQRAHKLELENTKLKAKLGVDTTDEDGF